MPLETFGFAAKGVYVRLNTPSISSFSLLPLTFCVQIVREKKEVLHRSRNAIPLPYHPLSRTPLKELGSLGMHF